MLNLAALNTSMSGSLIEFEKSKRQHGLELGPLQLTWLTTNLSIWESSCASRFLAVLLSLLRCDLNYDWKSLGRIQSSKNYSNSAIWINAEILNLFKNYNRLILFLVIIYFLVASYEFIYSCTYYLLSSIRSAKLILLTLCSYKPQSFSNAW